MIRELAVVLGTALICFGAWIAVGADRVLPLADQVLALGDLSSRPLIENGPELAEMDVSVPNSPEWLRVYTAWGYPSWFIGIKAGDRRLLCFSEARRADVTVDGGGRAVRTTSVPPYGYSGSCKIDGFVFNARPGERLRTAVALTSSTPGSSLFVTAYWGWETKDKIVAADMAVWRYRFALGICALGVLMVVGCTVGMLRRTFRRTAGD